MNVQFSLLPIEVVSDENTGDPRDTWIHFMRARTLLVQKIENPHISRTYSITKIQVTQSAVDTKFALVEDPLYEKQYKNCLLSKS